MEKKFKKLVEQKLRSIHKNKRGVMGQVISIFVVMLVISVLAGLTFLFVANLKDQIETTATYAENSTAYQAVNKTEYAGYQTTTYIALLFLALIFGAILTVVLRVILPYVNLGQNLGGF